MGTFNNTFNRSFNQIGSNVNPEPPINALKFEDTEEYIFFEGQSEPDYITFETN